MALCASVLCYSNRALLIRPLCKYPATLKLLGIRLTLVSHQLPTIINDTGFSSSPNQTQLWTVIPYAVAAVLTVCVAFLSDRLKLRGVIVLFTLPLSIIGYSTIANVKSAQVKYGMTFLMAAGLYSSVPCILSWNSNNSAGHYKRATTAALQLGIANCGGLLASMSLPRSVASTPC